MKTRIPTRNRKGGNMEGPIIAMDKVENLQLTVKAGLCKVTFETDLSPQDFARLMHFSRQDAALRCMISSPQAIFDLQFERVDLRTGEVR
jgi:hypothetical protein